MQAHLVQNGLGGCKLHIARAAPQQTILRQELSNTEAGFASRALASVQSSCPFRSPKRQSFKTQEDCAERYGPVGQTSKGTGSVCLGGARRWPTQAVAEAGHAETSSVEEADGEKSENNDGLYKPFVEYAVKALGMKMELWPYPIKVRHLD